jgi:hypothetical protein
LKTGSLALVLFVAMALPTTMHGKKPATRESAPVKATKTEVIDNFSFSPKTLYYPVGKMDCRISRLSSSRLFHLVT